jgi:hypothetical protein
MSTMNLQTFRRLLEGLDGVHDIGIESFMFELQKKTLCSFCYGVYFMSNIMCVLQHLICI